MDQKDHGLQRSANQLLSDNKVHYLLKCSLLLVLCTVLLLFIFNTFYSSFPSLSDGFHYLLIQALPQSRSAKR